MISNLSLWFSLNLYFEECPYKRLWNPPWAMLSWSNVLRGHFQGCVVLMDLCEHYVRLCDRIDIGRWQYEIFKICQWIIYFTSHFLLWRMFCLSNYSKTAQIVSNCLLLSKLYELRLTEHVHILIKNILKLTWIKKPFWQLVLRFFVAGEGNK